MKGFIGKKEIPGFITGLAGALLLFFMSWEYNMAFAVWLIPVLLIFCFRSQARWYMTLPIAVLCVVMKIAALHGGWDISMGLEIAFGVLVSVPLLAALYLDRALCGKLKPFAATLVFPAAYTALDFLLSYSPIGATFSIPDTQSRQLLLMQGASLLGSWFVGFVVVWAGPVANIVLQRLIDLRHSATSGICLEASGARYPGRMGEQIMQSSTSPRAFNLKKSGKTLAAYVLILAVLLGYGSAKMVFTQPGGKTVRIGSISVTHPQDFWSLTDAGTPRSGSDENKKVMAGVDGELFRLSQKAADYGAKIIFWSEGNYVMYEDQYDAFMQRATDFAKQNKVYLMAAILTLRYDSYKNDNKTIMIDPDGKVAFQYEKTYSWYPTDSDGIIRKVDTPYGRIGSAICFDMDFPGFIHQASDVDIMLVPAFDTRKISPYHTKAALIRGVENGFSVVRQCNDGFSAAADYNGNILASQDYYTVDERSMISDVPIKGITTLYGLTGEWFAWLCLAALAFFVGYLIKSKIPVRIVK